MINMFNFCYKTWVTTSEFTLLATNIHCVSKKQWHLDCLKITQWKLNQF